MDSKTDVDRAQVDAVVRLCDCGNPASCYGEYDSHKGFACDTCCGHGNEDGWCLTLDEYDAGVSNYLHAVHSAIE
jgi:hypothetical protein